MSTAAIEAREEKLNWLLRPFNWALHAAAYGLILAILIWTDPRVTTITVDVIAYALIMDLGIVVGFLLWGIRRVNSAARGRI